MRRSRKLIVGVLAALVAGVALAVLFGLRARAGRAPKIEARIAGVTRGNALWHIEVMMLNRSSSVLVADVGQVEFREGGRWQEEWNPPGMAKTTTHRIMPPGIGFTNRFYVPTEATHFRLHWSLVQQSGLGIRAAWICWRLGLRPDTHPGVWDLVNRLPNHRDVLHEIKSLEMPLPVSVDSAILRVPE